MRKKIFSKDTEKCKLSQWQAMEKERKTSGKYI